MSRSRELGRAPPSHADTPADDLSVTAFRKDLADLLRATAVWLRDGVRHPTVFVWVLWFEWTVGRRTRRFLARQARERAEELSRGALNQDDTPAPMAQPLSYLRPDDVRPAWVRRLGVLLCFYPPLLLAALYGTGLAAWAVLGHRPVPFVNDAALISPIVEIPRWVFALLLISAWPVLATHLALGVVAMVAWRRAGRRIDRRGVVLAIAGTLAWSAAFVVLWWDPWRVTDWYTD